MTKILLVKPPMVDGSDYYELPLNLAYLAAALINAGHDVRIADLQFIGWDEFSVLLANNAFDIVGTTTYSYSLVITKRICAAVRALNKDIPIILGGPHASFSPQETLERFPEVNGILRGESEECLVTLCNLIAMRGSVEACADDVHNLAIRNKMGCVGPKIAPPIDSVIPASKAFHLFNIPRSLQRNPYMPILASRGCVYKCTFCLSPVNWGRMRIRSWGGLREELDFYLESGFSRINFLDDVFSLLHPLMPHLIPYMKEHSMRWGCETRLDDMDPLKIREFCASGMERIRVSAETIHDSSLKLIKKNRRACDIIERVKLMTELCPDVQVSFMIGIPGETADQIRATMDFADLLRPANCRFWAYSPLPGTPIYENPQEHGIVRILPHEQYNPHVCYIETVSMTNDEINILLAEAYQRFELTRQKHLAETGHVQKKTTVH